MVKCAVFKTETLTVEVDGGIFTDGKAAMSIVLMLGSKLTLEALDLAMAGALANSMHQ